jgi:DNA modification methylase
VTDPHYADDRAIVYHGDCREVLTELADVDGWADAVITDPPYELKFMGKSWDGLGVAFDPETWKHCYDVLKPGGYLLCFGGTRTFHRIACAIEDAGFEIRDSIAWLYGSGFPKSLDVSKAIDKAAGAEREIVGQRTDGRYAYEFSEAASRSGGIMGEGSVQESRGQITAPATDAAKQWQGWGTALKPAFEPIIVARKPLGEKTVAANVLAHGTGALNIDACRVPGSADALGGQGRIVDDGKGRWPTNVLLDGETADQLDQQSGVLTSGRIAAGAKKNTGMRGNVFTKEYQEHPGDSGGASRFFPVFRYQAKAPTKERPKIDGVAHPTVKPLELMRWLIKLVTPPGGVIVDPFAGSGTTIEAALAEGVQVVGIEYTADYLPLITHRIERSK